MPRKTAAEIARLSFGERLKLAKSRTDRWLVGLLTGTVSLLATPFVVDNLVNIENEWIRMGMFAGSIFSTFAAVGVCVCGASRDSRLIIGPIYERYGIDRAIPSRFENIDEGAVLDSFAHSTADGQRGTASLVSMGPDAEPKLVFAPDPVVAVQLIDELPARQLAPALEARA